MQNDGQTRVKRVAILIEQNVEDSEFQIPCNALKNAGAEVFVLGSRMNEEYKGKRGEVSVKPDGTTTEASADEFDAVVIPGGMAPDRMRTNLKTVHFVQNMMQQGKLVAAVCHGPQVLIEGDLLRGKRVTGFRAIRKDLQNAGAEVEDIPVVADGNLITSRRPGDLPIFTTSILRHLDLSIPNTTLPGESDLNEAWWKLGEAWGGSTKSEIVNAINTAIAGERYALEAFESCIKDTTDAEIRAVFEQICQTKRHHLDMLQARLQILGERESLPAIASSVYADLKNWLHVEKSDAAMLRRVLGDLQTGVVDIYNLRNKLTDPATVAIFDEMEVNLAKDEQRVADLYHTRLVAETTPPPQPTSNPAVKA